MFIQKIKLSDFRNYPSLELDFPENIVIFYGANGQGKTNLLEAINILGGGWSFRTRRLSQVIRYNCQVARISGSVCRDGRQINLKVNITSKDKFYFCDGKRKENPHDYGTIVYSIITPQNIQLIEGSPKLRRDFLDRSIYDVYPSYLSSYRDYYRVMANRNKVLEGLGKNKNSLDELKVWDESLANLGAIIIQRRLHLVKDFNRLIPNLHKDLTASDESVSLEYKSFKKWNLTEDVFVIKNALMEGYERKRKEEIERKATLIGPHRDDLNIFLNGRRAVEYASIGQKRSIILSLAVAKIAQYRELKNDTPVFIIDDLELDTSRCKGFLNFITTSFPQMQIFISTIDKEKFNLPSFASRQMEVINGTVKANSSEVKSGHLSLFSFPDPQIC